MKRFCGFFALVWFISVEAIAQECIVMPIWPDGAPTSNGLTGEEKGTKNITNVTNSTLLLYLPQNPDGRVVVMCPGGGYGCLCMDYEGYDMAPWFNAQGITFGVLKYRMPNGHSEVPLDDIQEVVRLIRRNADLWHINPCMVGVMGASAGGHLVSLAATHYDFESRPDFQILLYPVISMQLPHSYGGYASKFALFGPEPTQEQMRSYSSNQNVTKDTPLAFIALSNDDKRVSPIHSILYFNALYEHNVQASLHIYPIGGHGWGFLDTFLYKPNWTADLAKWLATGLDTSNACPMLRVGKTFLGTPYVPAVLDENDEERLVIKPDSVDCVTFVEYTLARALGSAFEDNLRKIRYRDGIIDGYCSRLHYISDWINNGLQHGFLQDITATYTDAGEKLSLSYMTSHTESYPRLKNSKENTERMAAIEKQLSGQRINYLPKAQLPVGGLEWIKDGDIIAIVSKIAGLDVAHMGIATYVNNELHLLHASLTEGKVVVSEQPLAGMLSEHKSWKGIRVVRMSNPRGRK